MEAAGQDLFFPTINVLASPISKVGNTALRSFLYAAEITQQNYTSDADRIRNFHSHLAPGTEIHNPASRIKEHLTRKGQYRESLSVVILRDPVDRFLSMYVDMFALAQIPIRIAPYLQHEWMVKSTDELTNVHERVLRLLNWLEVDNHINVDEHWTPQVNFMVPNFTYDITLDINNLHSLPQRLAHSSQKLHWLENIEMPVRHQSNSTVQNLLGTEEIRARISSLYADDYTLRESLDLPTSVPPQVDTSTSQLDWPTIRTDLLGQQINNLTEVLAQQWRYLELSRAVRLARAIKRNQKRLQRLFPFR